jgi:hypothetical protein
VQHEPGATRFRLRLPRVLSRRAKSRREILSQIISQIAPPEARRRPDP